MTVEEILKCKLFNAAANIAYSDSYGIKCSEQSKTDLIKYYNYLKIYTSTCEKTFDVLCLIEESVVGYNHEGCSNKYNQGVACTLTFSDITPVTSSSCSPLILIQKS